MQAKMETAAERYKRIREEKARQEPLFDVTCECGMDWKCRRIGVDVFIANGILPVHLVEKLNKVMGADQSKAAEILKNMAFEDVVKSIAFSSKVVRLTAAEPCIKDKPEGPNDISQEDVMRCCYSTLLQWQMKGGEQASGLASFRPE